MTYYNFNNLSGGVISGYAKVTDSDVFAFDVARNHNIHLNLYNTSTSDDVSLSLFYDKNKNGILDSRDRRVASSDSANNAADVIHYNGRTGTYFAQVAHDNFNSNGGAEAPYRLDLAATMDLGTLTDKMVRRNRQGVSAADPTDVFEFSVTGDGTTSLDLHNIRNGDASVRLFQDSNRNGVFDIRDSTVAVSPDAGETNDQLVFNTSAGIYFAQVVSNTIDSPRVVSYDLDFSFRDLVAVPTDLNSPIGGVGNNLRNPLFGSVGSELLDSVPLQYGDGVSSPAGQRRPNARVISNAISQQNGDVPDARGLTNLIWAWGQFLDHDISLSPDDLGPENRVVISVPNNDPVLSPGNVIALQETAFEEGTGTGPNNPRRLPNEITAWIDGSNVYGSSEERLEQLRAFDGGRLLVSRGNLLPIFGSGDIENDNPGVPGRSLFAAGDVRANENSVLASVHTLFVREHNRLANEIKYEHPNWNDEKIFERARQLNVAQMQNITFNEYLPTLLGSDLSRYRGYDFSVNPGVERVFSSAAFRLGHTQLSSTIERLTVGGESESSLTLADVFFPDTGLLQSSGIDNILRGIASSLSQAVDNLVIEDVRSLLFGEGPNAPARDLVAINIERGRLNGVADYNTVRESYGLQRVRSFSDITTDTNRQRTLQSLYGSVNDIDAFVGFLAEDQLAGSSVGESLDAILRDQFERLRDGDRFYFENSLSQADANAVREVTLSDIIRRNTNTFRLQDTAFSLQNTGTNRSDKLNGGLGEDVISGGGGNDEIYGWTDNDRIMGDRGNDTLFGGDGNDVLIGGVGNDTLFGDDGYDELIGGNGNDVFFGTQTGVSANGEIDVLTGGGGSDFFVLGNEDFTYYNDGDRRNQGLGDYALITDFNAKQDKLLFHGSRSQYQLETTASGTNVFYTEANSTQELIATVRGSSVNLNSYYVFFA